MPKTLKIELASTIILIGFCLAVGFHYVMAFYFDKDYILNTFLFNPNHQEYSDFFSDYLSSKHLSPYTNEHISAYFPAAYLLFYPFTFLGRHFGPSIYSLIFTSLIAYFCWFYLKRNSGVLGGINKENQFINFKNVFIFSFMTFPVLYAFERGNLESMLFAFLLFSLYFYSQKKYVISALLLSFPISMKVYPMVFLVLFFSDKHYKETIVCLFMACILTLLSLLIFNGAISDQLNSLKETMAIFSQNYVGGTGELPFNLSYYGFYQTIHAIFQHIPWGNPLPYYQSFLYPYSLFCFVFFGLISLYIVFFEKLLWKKIALLVSSMILFPYISYDYKLLHIYLPFFFFVNAKPESFKRDLKYIIIFSLLFIPKNYMRVYGEVSIATLMDTVLLTVLIVLIILDSFNFSKKFIKK